MLSIINSIIVMPNRFLYKIDAANDYFKTQISPIGVIRLTVEKASGFVEEKESPGKRFLSKLTGASPDTYCKVSVGAEEPWRTTTKNNTTNPSWDEVHDFVVTDLNQCITVDLLDHDLNSDDQIGIGVTTVKDILSGGGKHELSLVHKDQPIEGKVSLSCKFFHVGPDDGSFSASEHGAEGLLCGIATVLVSGAYGVPGRREELAPSVAVTWGEKHHFQTAVVTDTPGTDISNPTFDSTFRIPVTADMVASGAQSFRIALLNKKLETGSVEIPLSDVQNAPDMVLQNTFDVGGGAAVRASISLRGIVPASLEELTLPQH